MVYLLTSRELSELFAQIACLTDVQAHKQRADRTAGGTQLKDLRQVLWLIVVVIYFRLITRDY